MCIRDSQYLGVNEAVSAYENRKLKDGRLGVFWHTQGSGTVSYTHLDVYKRQNQYCMPVLGLIFLRYANSRFKLVEQEILKDLSLIHI